MSSEETVFLMGRAIHFKQDLSTATPASTQPLAQSPSPVGEEKEQDEQKQEGFVKSQHRDSLTRAAKAVSHHLPQAD